MFLYKHKKHIFLNITWPKRQLSTVMKVFYNFGRNARHFLDNRDALEFEFKFNGDRYNTIYKQIKSYLT